MCILYDPVRFSSLICVCHFLSFVLSVLVCVLQESVQRNEWVDVFVTELHLTLSKTCCYFRQQLSSPATALHSMNWLWRLTNERMNDGEGGGKSWKEKLINFLIDTHTRAYHQAIKAAIVFVHVVGANGVCMCVCSPAECFSFALAQYRLKYANLNYNSQCQCTLQYAKIV